MVSVKMEGVTGNNHEKFTVKRQSRIDFIAENKDNDGARTSIYLSFFKWIFTICMFTFTLLCLVLSKLSLISIGQRLGNGTLRESFLRNMYSVDVSDNYESDVAFTMIILFMMIPHAISFMRSFANSAFSSTELWPSRRSLVWGVIASFLETIGLCLFSLIVIGAMRNFIQSIFLMNGIFVFPVFYQMIREIRKVASRKRQQSPDEHQYIKYATNTPLPNERNEQYSWLTLIRFTLSTFLAFGGFGFLIYVATSTVERIMIPASMICLSIAWSPKMLKLLVNPEITNGIEYRRILSNSSVKNITVKTARNRITLITSAIKLFLTLLFAFALNYFINVGGNSNPGISIYNGFKYFTENKQMLTMFFLQVLGSIFGYLMCWLACTINLQKICFVLPLLLSTPVSTVVFDETVCELLTLTCHEIKHFGWWKTVILGVLMWLSQVISLNVEFFKSQQFLMAREEYLFWLPSYDALLLEQHLLLNRKSEITDEKFVNYHEIVKNSHIYICTTMYREADYEMEQLLKSLAKIDEARKECKRQFESHIWFDDGVRGDVIKLYALQLISLVQGAMKIDPGKAFKLETPYGLQLKWILPHGMPFILHLKDKVKVKNKKRWSQVMYMSYILDFKEKDCDDDLTYILATDADVKFTPNDVMALMDFMSRNPQVAAVCGRTHPMGSGPLVWYQIFDYAIGHWLLKVANHVFGSVLCSPGCFSVYRATAIRDVLPLYATGVSTAMDFLMKDMGEDRWFCTLLVEAGWTLEYCATAVDSTYCPEEFDEFFKQRRRWGPSTLANSLVVLNKQKDIRANNDSINLFFIGYQLILIFSTVIGPSTVLLVVSGGLQYAYPAFINLMVVLILLIVITVVFTLICLYCSQETQLKTAKMLTCFFAIIMAITTVGLIKQSVDNVNKYMHLPTKMPPTHGPSPTVELFDAMLKTKIPPTTSPGPPNPSFITAMSPATLYLFFIIGVFILTAILHGTEATNLIHGIWYLLCLPSGYLLLTIYSVANLTDRSWGTREGKTQSVDADKPWAEHVIKYLKYMCWCCVPPHLRGQSEEKQEKESEQDKEEIVEKDETDSCSNLFSEDGKDSENEGEQKSDNSEFETSCEIDFESSEDSKTFSPHSSTHISPPIKSAMKSRRTVSLTSKRRSSGGKVKQSAFRFPGQRKVKFARNRFRMNSATTVEEWLPNEYKVYTENFKKHGYDDVSFIAGFIKEKDLQDIGITNRGHRKRLMVAVESLPPEEFLQEIPENVEDWLLKLGLDEYWQMFSDNSYTEPRDLADIKYMSSEMISSIFNITKKAHLKKLKMATEVLQYPTKAQTLIRDARKAIMAEPTKNLQTDNADAGEEHEFWEELREICLLPEQAAFNLSGELVEKLGEMRNTCLMVLAIANVLWLTFMVTVMYQESLTVYGTSFASVAFLFVYTLVLVLQFLSLLWHRLETVIHFIARAPFKPGHLKSNWAWRDKDLPAPPEPELLDEIRRRQRRMTSNQSSNQSSNHTSDDEIPLTYLTEPLVGRRQYDNLI